MVFFAMRPDRALVKVAFKSTHSQQNPILAVKCWKLLTKSCVQKVDSNATVEPLDSEHAKHTKRQSYSDPVGHTWHDRISISNKDATRNKCHASSNKGLTTNKKLLYSSSWPYYWEQGRY